MLPVLFTVSGFPITSFGLFLTLAFLTGLFFIWRAAQVYEIDPEKLLDLFFLTVFVSFTGARLYFLAFHPDYLNDPLKVLLFNLYPGFSFWGALAGGSLGLYFFAGRFRLNLWQVFDFAAVGLFIGLVFANLGCLLGSCQYGVESSLPVAVSQAGVIGQRFPVQALEALFFFFGFLYLWKKLLRFHFAGSITALGLMLLGLIKFWLEFYRADVQLVPFLQISFGFFWAALCFLLGVKIYYRQSRRLLRSDLSFLGSLFINSSRRKQVVSNYRKSCYNLLINFKFALKNKKRNLFKSLNVKPNPTKFQ